MEYLILGPGSLGLLVGGLLADAGHSVTFLARGRNLEALEKGRLNILGLKTLVVKGFRVVGRPGDLKGADFAILTVKYRDSRDLLDSLSHLKGTGTVFLSLQNIMRKEELLASRFGRESVLGAASDLSVTLREPGVVDYTEPGHTFVGEYPSGRSARSAQMVNDLAGAGLPAQERDDMEAVNWHKLVSICSVAGLAALTRLFLHELLQDAALAGTMHDLVREGVNVMKGIGVEPMDIPGIRLRSLYEMDRATAIGAMAEKGISYRDSGLVRIRPSMLQDVMAGRKTEAEEVMGFLLETGATIGVHTPTLGTIYTLVRGLESGFPP